MLLTIGLATLLASAAQASQEQLARSMRESQLETARTSEQLKAHLVAINDLTKQKEGDLRPAYDAFCRQVAQTESVASLTRTRVNWMAGDGRSYFKEWQKSIDGIANESLRKKAEKRLDAVRESFDKVDASLQLASEKFKPFLSDLADIQKGLSTDVTAGGVKAIKGTVKSANWDHQYVNKAIDGALKAIDAEGAVF